VLNSFPSLSLFFREGREERKESKTLFYGLRFLRKTLTNTRKNSHSQGVARIGIRAEIRKKKESAFPRNIRKDKNRHFTRGKHEKKKKKGSVFFFQ